MLKIKINSYVIMQSFPILITKFLKYPAGRCYRYNIVR